MEDISENATLTDLPPDVFANILKYLHARDIVNLQLAGKSLNHALEDERIWSQLCEIKWSSRTNIRKWLPKTQKHPPSAMKLPTTYKQLFHLLHEVHDLCGLWRVVSYSPKATRLVLFSWTAQGMIGELVSYREHTRNVYSTIRRRKIFDITPRKGLFGSISWEDEDNSMVLLQKRFSNKDSGSSSSRMHRSSSGEAVAAVGFGTPSRSSMSILGSSPQGSFEHSWMQFSSAMVRPSSSGRRRQRRSSRPGQDRLNCYLKRINVPKPTAAHPLSGIYMTHEPPWDKNRLVSISYDFSGTRAKIVARSMVSHYGNIPFNQILWEGLCSPYQDPESDELIFSKIEAICEREALECAQYFTRGQEMPGLGDYPHRAGLGIYTDDEEDERFRKDWEPLFDSSSSSEEKEEEEEKGHGSGAARGRAHQDTLDDDNDDDDASKRLRATAIRNNRIRKNTQTVLHALQHYESPAARASHESGNLDFESNEWKESRAISFLIKLREVRSEFNEDESIRDKQGILAAHKDGMLSAIWRVGFEDDETFTYYVRFKRVDHFVYGSDCRLVE